MYAFEIDGTTVCQCTGVTDKNDKLIWENDIISAHLDERFPDNKSIALVVWDKYSWRIKECGFIGYDELDEFVGQQYEVISNIFDNLELLEGGAE